MPLASLQITDFRNLTAIDFTPGCLSGLNLLYGKNGSGKTSLLEAIYYLGRGRSFRSTTTTRLIRYQQEKFSLVAQVINESQQQITMGMERGTQDNTRFRIAEKDASSLTDFIRLLPLRLINSQSHHLFEGGPAFRRKYLDWGLFYHDERFLHTWRHFERVLKQRNALLRDKCSRAELEVWTHELVHYGVALNQLREKYLHLLTPYMEEMVSALLGATDITWEYAVGWERKSDYATMLAQAYREEIRVGYTIFGPHRADLNIWLNRLPAKHFLSRGQQKLLICAMILAQGMLFAAQTNKGLIYLIDDLPAELDLASRQKLISLLAKQSTQIFITATQREMISDSLTEKANLPLSMFHVEHGKVLAEANHDNRWC